MIRRTPLRKKRPTKRRSKATPCQVRGCRRRVVTDFPGYATASVPKWLIAERVILCRAPRLREMRGAETT